MASYRPPHPRPPIPPPSQNPLPSPPPPPSLPPPVPPPPPSHQPYSYPPPPPYYQQQPSHYPQQFNQHQAPPLPPPTSPPPPPPPPSAPPPLVPDPPRDKGDSKPISAPARRERAPSKHHRPHSRNPGVKIETEEERRLRKKRELEKQRQEEKLRQQMKSSHKSQMPKGHTSVVGSRAEERKPTPLLTTDRVENRLKKPTTFICKLKSVSFLSFFLSCFLALFTFR